MNIDDKLTKQIKDKVQDLMNNFKEGRYDFDGGAFLNAESYLTKPSDQKDFEAHRKFIDVQIVVSGQEIIEVADINNPNFKITKPYVPDIMFMNGEVEKKIIELRAGESCVLYPSDAHKPCINLDGEHRVQKIVIKLPTNI
ncbi:MAG: DUF386 domain-containing protein [Alphaproteobacteria bacterium]|nr:DUF386 domain-containing protein [Alphaproteobacteria bacterium]